MTRATKPRQSTPISPHPGAFANLPLVFGWSVTPGVSNYQLDVIDQSPAMKGCHGPENGAVGGLSQASTPRGGNW